jgi:hypothetical protein
MDLDNNSSIRRLYRTAFLVGVLLLHAVHPAIGSEVRVNKLHKDDWERMTSENFDVLSNASEKQTVLMIEELENFNFFLSKLLGYENQSLAHKVPVVLTKNRSSFESLGISGDYAGLFSNIDGGLIFARADKFRSSSRGANWGRSVVLHELTHLLTRSSNLQIATPPWYREGIAEYLGTYVRKRNKVILGDLSVLNNSFYALLKRGGGNFENVDSESLFKITQKDLNVGKKRSRKQDVFLGKFYARSVTVVHYLNADPQRRRQMYRYLSLIDKGYARSQSFQHAFKLSYEEFDRRVNKYIDGKFVVARVFEVGKNGLVFPEVAIQSVQMSRSQVLAFLYDKISLLSEDILSSKHREKMNEDVESLIPGFFAE